MQRPSSAGDKKTSGAQDSTRGSETAGPRKAGRRDQHVSWVMSNQRPDRTKEQVWTVALGTASWREVGWGTQSQPV